MATCFNKMNRLIYVGTLENISGQLKPLEKLTPRKILKNCQVKSEESDGTF